MVADFQLSTLRQLIVMEASHLRRQNSTPWEFAGGGRDPIEQNARAFPVPDEAGRGSSGARHLAPSPASVVPMTQSHGEKRCALA